MHPIPAVPDGLPPWANAVATLMLLVGYGFVLWGARKKPVAGADAPNAIIAGDIMATKPMADLAKAVERVAENVALQAAAQDRAAAASDRAAAASDRAAEATHRSEDAMRDLCQALRDRR